MSKIVTQFDMKPIPPREFDWSATFDDYEGGHIIGYGKTEIEAVADLLVEAEASERHALEDYNANIRDNGQFGVGA